MYTLQQEDLSDKVYKAIKHLILQGELSPGEKLYQEKRAENLGISRKRKDEDVSRKFKEIDYQFHNLIMEMSDNFFLKKMISSYNIISLSEHELILTAVLEGKPEEAEAAMYAHIEGTRNLIAKWIKEKNNEQA